MTTSDSLSIGPTSLGATLPSQTGSLVFKRGAVDDFQGAPVVSLSLVSTGDADEEYMQLNEFKVSCEEVGSDDLPGASLPI